MTASGPGVWSGAGPIRQAVEGLLRGRSESVDTVDQWERKTHARMMTVAQAVQAVRVPHASQLADSIISLAEETRPAFRASGEQVTASFASEVHGLLNLLHVTKHLGRVAPLPPFNPVTVAHSASVAEIFPPGFAREYVAAVAPEIDAGRATTKQDACAQQPRDVVDVRQAMDDVVAAAPARHQQAVRELVTNPDCHAVQMHGPHITAEELELRVGWKRPPNVGTPEADAWRHRHPGVGNGDGRVKTKHAVGSDTSVFATPEAFTQPLVSFLDIAEQHPDGLDGFLDEHADAGDAAFFLPADSANLKPGETFAYRGTGTATEESAQDWVAMRAGALHADHDCLDPVRTIRFDPITDGSDPGVRLVFKNRGRGWELSTYYSARTPGVGKVRLEDAS